MKLELACRMVREDLSARLDGEVDDGRSAELDAHLATCSDCRRFEADLTSVRRALRTRPAEPVPDLSRSIMSAIETHRVKGLERNMWRPRLRAAAIGAAASIIVLLGASLPFGRDGGDVASASQIVARLRAAAQSLTSYAASFEMTERGWHPQIETRNFEIEVAFGAPERFRLSISDVTPYPPDERWPRNDVDLVSDGRRWSLREPAACPVKALPGCLRGGTTRTTVTERVPFDGSTPLPTDIVVPLQSLVDSNGVVVLGASERLGRRVQRIALPFRQAAPLIASLQQGGMWRSVHPADRVLIDLDQESWFPLRVEVLADDSAERSAWARREGYRDRPGERILLLDAVSFSIDAQLEDFAVPVRGAVRSGGFRPRPVGGPTPAYLADLRPAGEGRVGQYSIHAYADGLAWLKVGGEAEAKPTLGTATAEEIALSNGGVGYYLPASPNTPRRVDLFGPEGHVWVETNLSRDRLIAVADSIPFSSEPLPSLVHLSPELSLTRVDVDALPDDLAAPRSLPDGYRSVGATRSASDRGGSTLTVFYRRAQSDIDDVGISLVRTRPVDRLAPPSTEFVEVDVGGVPGRWSAERGELEWLRNGSYWAISAPSFDLSAILEVAETLR